MTAVLVEPADLLDLPQLVPDLNFEDEERRAALLENGSRDFNAVPGSGKTSLLAAKLLLLARKWPHAHKGICVLSHTNVARGEITQRLAGSVEGTRLLAYPHFIGTIHGFVNHFLAMSALRAHGVKVDVIDDAIFARKAWDLAMTWHYPTLRGWLNKQANAQELIEQLYFRSATHEVASEGGVLPGVQSDTYKQALALKRSLAQDGVFRHRDMFAYAELALEGHAHLLDVVHRRFPMVFVDEMQDTSWEQEDILNRLFDGHSVMQRYGDIDQKIILNDADEEKATFPRQGHGTVSTSKRFGSRIAAAVASVRISQLPVVGEAPDGFPPVLTLYKTANVHRVVYRFGQLVMDRFDDASLKDSAVRAMCARRGGDGNVEVGRHMSDYWPPFNQLRLASNHADLGSLLQAPRSTQPQPTLSERVNDLRRGVLQVLRAAKAPVAQELRDGRSLLRAVRELTGDALQLQKLVRELTLTPPSFATDGDRAALALKLHEHLVELLPPGMTADALTQLDVFGTGVNEDVTSVDTLSPTVCAVVHASRQLEYTLGTVASMKGETHKASLVMESYGGVSRRFDLELALPFIAGVGKKFEKLTPTQRTQMRNLYVAMSRPTQFLCLAANEARVGTQTLDALEGKGWIIDRIPQTG